MTTDRDQLAEALLRFDIAHGLIASQSYAGLADALLPVVDAIARHRAATELRDAADDDAEAFPGEVAVPTYRLRDRADTLERQDPQ
jgi:hypothetical protein